MRQWLFRIAAWAKTAQGEGISLADQVPRGSRRRGFARLCSLSAKSRKIIMAREAAGSCG